LRNLYREYPLELMATGTHHEHTTPTEQIQPTMSDGRELEGSTEHSRLTQMTSL